VLKEYTFQGHGTRVTTHLLQIFAQSGTTTVNVDAPNALGFYKKMGFFHDYGMQVCTIKLTPSWVRENRLRWWQSVRVCLLTTDQKMSDAAMMCAWVRVGVATLRTPFVVAGGSSGKLELHGD
jgi:hypothetical protein